MNEVSESLQSEQRARRNEAASVEPWVETREGGFFFLNALLVAPEFMVLFPLTVRAILRGIGLLDRPSRVLDPIPAFAEYFLPVLGWLLIIPIVLVLYNLRMPVTGWAQRGLWVFLTTHLAFLGYTIYLWATP